MRGAGAVHIQHPHNTNTQFIRGILNTDANVVPNWMRGAVRVPGRQRGQHQEVQAPGRRVLPQHDPAASGHHQQHGRQRGRRRCFRRRQRLPLVRAFQTCLLVFHALFCLVSSLCLHTTFWRWQRLPLVTFLTCFCPCGCTAPSGAGNGSLSYPFLAVFLLVSVRVSAQNRLAPTAAPSGDLCEHFSVRLLIHVTAQAGIAAPWPPARTALWLQAADSSGKRGRSQAPPTPRPLTVYCDFARTAQAVLRSFSDRHSHKCLQKRSINSAGPQL